MNTLLLIVIGLSAGMLSGLFGIGGGVLIVPALVYGLGFSQKLATGTSLAILLPPVGLAAVLEYYRGGYVDIKAAAFIAIALVIGAWFGARWGSQASTEGLKAGFGIFLVVLGLYIVYDVYRKG